MQNLSVFDARKVQMATLHKQVQVLIADALSLAHEGKFVDSLNGLNEASNFLEQNADSFSRKHLKYLRLQLIKARDARLTHMYKAASSTKVIKEKTQQDYSSDSDEDFALDQTSESNNNNAHENDGKQEKPDARDYCLTM